MHPIEPAFRIYSKTGVICQISPKSLFSNKVSRPAHCHGNAGSGEANFSIVLCYCQAKMKTSSMAPILLNTAKTIYNADHKIHHTATWHEILATVRLVGLPQHPRVSGDRRTCIKTHRRSGEQGHRPPAQLLRAGQDDLLVESNLAGVARAQPGIWHKRSWPRSQRFHQICHDHRLPSDEICLVEIQYKEENRKSTTMLVTVLHMIVRRRLRILA